MRRRSGARLALGIGAALLLAAAGAGLLLAWRPPAPALIASATPVRVSSAHFTDVPVAMPGGSPVGLALLVSGSGGPGAADAALSEGLRRRGLMVLSLDLETWRAGLERDAGPCLRPMSDVEDLSKNLQRALKAKRYFHPVLLGVGEGGALVHAILGQALSATVAGGVALEPAETLALRRPLCDGLPAEPAPDGFRYPRQTSLQEPFIVVQGAAPPHSEPGAARGPHRPETRLRPEPEARIAEAAEAAVTLAARDAGTGQLPIVEHPAVGPARALAIFYSGDGGWRDIDKTIGDRLAREGVHVIGVDALRYFWSEKAPQTVAADTVSALKAADPDGRLPILVLGYSFGADVFPFAWPYLPASLTDRIGLVALLGPGRSTGFSVSVKGFLGLGGAHAVVPQIAALPAARVLCIYGSAEKEPACTDPSLAGIRTIRLEGGHHFDGDYPGIARRILEALRPAG
ncbi:AcvB/VirJ family lysyl-phosphatidylglycerol hydrolase [Methylobacterium segetis]|uniref:AcvB/VirJ family lysyl-phosphatidylglycerol hydrolase n=1 Tax=Methylobacterium segetis TaxID=2488750 RepID=UPI001046B317|nr:AcvB/VirJ family lysyl-phosphatidylglycerol hydrolase [Methylobacterium segetis]